MVFRFLGSRLFALLERGAARMAASRIEIRFEPIPPGGGSDIPGETWDRIVVRPAGAVPGPSQIPSAARPHDDRSGGPVSQGPGVPEPVPTQDLDLRPPPRRAGGPPAVN